MANPFPYESFQWFWFEYWLPVAAAGIAIFALASIWGTTKQGIYSSFIRVLAVLGVVASIPLASERIDMGGAGDEDVMLLMSVGGAIAGLSLLWFHMLVLLVGKRRGKSSFAYATGGQAAPADMTGDFGGYRAAGDFKSTVAVQGSVTPIAGGTVLSAQPVTDRTIVETKPRTTGAWLTVQSGANAGQVLALPDDVARIGRSPDNDLILSDVSVSRSHAVIRKSGNSYEILDAGSSAGTSVNGQLVSGTAIPGGGSLRVGQTDLMFTNIESYAAQAQVPVSDKTMFGGDAKGTDVVAIVRSGPDAGKSFRLGAGVHRIGRDVTSEIRLEDQAVSRKHATLRVGDKGVSVFDEGSRGGTFVNGQRVSGTTLGNNDQIMLGSAKLVFVQPTTV